MDYRIGLRGTDYRGSDRFDKSRSELSERAPISKRKIGLQGKFRSIRFSGDTVTKPRYRPARLLSSSSNSVRDEPSVFTRF